MPGSRFKKLADRTTLHAVEDFYYANAAGKLFWGSLAAIAVALLVFQLGKVANSFYDQEIGSTQTQFSPDEMPALTICPDAWVSKARLDKLNSEADYNFTKETVSVINGLFPFLGMDQLYEIEDENIEKTLIFAHKEYGEPEFIKKLLPFWKDKANDSIHKLVELIGIERLNRHLGMVLPSRKNLTQNRVVTLSGVCFRFESDEKLNELQSLFGGVKLAFELDQEVVAPNFRKKVKKVNATKEPYFRLFLSRVGELDLVLPSEQTFEYGAHYIVLFSVNKVTRVNRRKWPCKGYTEADRFHCVASYGNNDTELGTGGFLNLHFRSQKNSNYSCQTPTPKTNRFDELKVKNPCNYFVDMAGTNLGSLNSLSHTNEKWNQICPKPCQISYYQYTYKERRSTYAKGRTWVRTLIEVKASQQVRSTQTEEYFLMPIEGMLSNVGGTLGLWVGASVMSLIQVFYLICLDGCLTKKTVETKTDKP